MSHGWWSVSMPRNQSLPTDWLPIVYYRKLSTKMTNNRMLLIVTGQNHKLSREIMSLLVENIFIQHKKDECNLLKWQKIIMQYKR